MLDYQFDWAAWLPDGDTISAHTVTADSGLAVGVTSATSTAVTVWLSGGLAQSAYRVTCRIETSAGRIDDRTMIISVREK